MTFLRRMLARRWVRYAVTAVLLALVVYAVHPHTLARAAAGARPGYLAAALLLTIPFLYLKALRWRLMLAAAGVQATFGEAINSLIGGMALALVTPARLGELARVAYLRDPQKLRIGGLVMIDKGFDVLALACLSVAGAWAWLGPWAGLLFAAVSLAGLAIVFEPAPLSGLLHLASARTPLRVKLERVWSSLESLGPRSSAVFLLLTLLAFGVVLLQFGVILLSWHSWSLNIVFLTFPLVILTNVLPITIGGLGVREAAAAVLLARYGIPSSQAVTAAFLMFGINTALPGLVGALVLPPGARSAAGAAPLADRP